MRVIGLVTHFFGFDSSSYGSFEERLLRSDVDELICANTRHGVLERIQKSEVLGSCVTVLDISPYLAQAIRNYQSGGTVKDMIRCLSSRRDLYRVAHGHEVD